VTAAVFSVEYGSTVNRLMLTLLPVRLEEVVR